MTKVITIFKKKRFLRLFWKRKPKMLQKKKKNGGYKEQWRKINAKKGEYLYNIYIWSIVKGLYLIKQWQKGMTSK